MLQTRRFGTRLHVVEGPTISFYGLPYPTRMCVIQLKAGGIFVHSPIQLTDEVRRFVEGLGTVQMLISPNKIHHLSLGEWAEAYPQAELWASPGLRKKRPELQFCGDLQTTPEVSWAEDVDQVIFEGSKVMDEVVFFHRESKTLLLADLVENFDGKTLGWGFHALAKVVGIVAPDGQAPVDYRLSFRDRDKARACLEQILGWEPEHTVMAHGVILSGTKELRHAFRWLLEK